MPINDNDTYFTHRGRLYVELPMAEEDIAYAKASLDAYVSEILAGMPSEDVVEFLIIIQTRLEAEIGKRIVEDEIAKRLQEEQELINRRGM